jgi:hypothetical protein
MNCTYCGHDIGMHVTACQYDGVLSLSLTFRHCTCPAFVPPDPVLQLAPPTAFVRGD